jgi:hypothetical protein
MAAFVAVRLGCGGRPDGCAEEPDYPKTFSSILSPE